MLKATDFLCFWNSWVVATRVVVAGRSALLLLLLALLEGALRFLQPTKSFAFLTTNQSRDKRSRDTRKQVSKLLSFSILFLSSSCRVKKKTKTLQRSVGRSCSAVGHRSNTPRPSALPDIAATHREVQRAAGHRSNVVTSSALLQQRRKNAASCNALGHRCSVARKRRRPPSPQRRLTSTRPTFVGHPLDFRPTFVRRLSNFRRTSVGFSSDFHRTSVPLSFVELPSDVRPTLLPTSLSTSLLTSSYCRFTCVIVDVIVLSSCILPTSLLTSLLTSLY